jgi:hypothetical protein
MEGNRVKSVLLGRKYSDFEWIMQGYITLATREEPMTLTVAERIGTHAVMEIAAIREEIVRMKAVNQSEQCHGRARREIVKKFGMELEHRWRS